MKLSIKDLEKRGTLKNIKEIEFECVSCGKQTMQTAYGIYKNGTYMITISLCNKCNEASYIPRRRSEV